jgi:type II secretory pathway predicted ATPase ExeA
MNLDALLNHFSLATHPFARAVSEAGLLRHRSFAETLTRLTLAVETRAPALLTAEPGLGKSTLLGVFADSLDKSKTRLVYTALCSCGPFGLVGQLAARYGVHPRRSAALTAMSILDELSRSDRTEILVLDEAHRLPDTSLDELRLLSNLDFDRTPPFSLLLVGQPDLRERLAETRHLSLAQRLAMRTCMGPLSESDSTDYLDRRLHAAGARATLFRPAAAARVFEKTCGVPRLMNNLATASLLAAAAHGRKHIEIQDVDDAAFDQEHN